MVSEIRFVGRVCGVGEAGIAPDDVRRPNSGSRLGSSRGFSMGTSIGSVSGSRIGSTSGS